MDRVWAAEITVAPELARTLVERQFADLAGAAIEPLGDGWDNTAYVVGGEWVFRFPRRRIAVDLVSAEIAVLPGIAPHLPLPVPVPTRVGVPGAGYPWPFAGYRRLEGRSAWSVGLDEDDRAAAAAPLGAFLAALHRFPSAEARRLGAGPDTLGRLDLDGRRRRKLEERLRDAVGAGLIASATPWQAVVDEVPAGWTAGADTLVHGDFHAGNILVNEDRRPCGVIDWGDVHLGDPAVDLVVAHAFLPPSARGAFREAYGPIDDDRWRVARFRALQSAAAILLYGHDRGDGDLVREALTALRHIRLG